MLPTVDDIYWDPFDVELDTSPYDTWRRMRDEAPVYRNDRYDFYALSRYADVHSASNDPRTFLSSHGTVLEMMGPDLSSTSTASRTRSGGGCGTRRPSTATTATGSWP